MVVLIVEIDDFARFPVDGGLMQVESAEQFLDTDAVMPGDAFENARQCPGPDRIVHRDHLMVLAALLRGDADMRAALADLPVAQPAQRRHQ